MSAPNTDKQIAEKDARIAELEAQVAVLTARGEALEAALDGIRYPLNRLRSDASVTGMMPTSVVFVWTNEIADIIARAALTSTDRTSGEKP